MHVRILVVEDDKASLEQMVYLIEASGREPIQADNERETGLEAGAERFIARSFSAEGLLAGTESCLGPRKGE